MLEEIVVLIYIRYSDSRPCYKLGQQPEKLTVLFIFYSFINNLYDTISFKVEYQVAGGNEIDNLELYLDP